MQRSRLLAFIVSTVVVLLLASSTLVLAEPGKGNGPDHARGKPFVQQTDTPTPTVTGTPPTATPTSTATSTATTTPTATGTPPTPTPTGTPAALEERPGLGCGDDNHIHTGAPGNPGLTCKDHADDDEGVVDEADED
jgi:hypothetical protein